jgi:hypothetical protein
MESIKIKSQNQIKDQIFEESSPHVRQILLKIQLISHKLFKDNPKLPKFEPVNGFCLSQNLEPINSLLFNNRKIFMFGGYVRDCLLSYLSKNKSPR